MTKDSIKCKVVGHEDGPKCETCGTPMDSLIVQTKGLSITGARGHYCYPCTIKGSN